MKKLILLSLIILVPFWGGFILQGVGSGEVERAGTIIMSYGTFITAVVIFVIGMVMMATGKLNDDENSDRLGRPVSEIDVKSSKPIEKSDEALEVSSLEEERKLDDVNSSDGYESKLKYAGYVAEKSAEIYRNSSKIKKVLGWIYFAFLVVNFTLTPIFFSLGIFIGGYICMGLFTATLIISIIVKLIIVNTGLSGATHKKREDWVIVKGTVKSCELAGVTSTGGETHRSSVRVTGAAYKVTATADGRDFYGYSKRVYGKGDSVNILVSPKADSNKMFIL